VTLKLGQECTAEIVGAGKPEAVIVASGSRPLIPDWPGMAESEAITAEAVFEGTATVGRRVLVVGGSGIGTETADYLSEMGKKVTLVEMLGGDRLGLVFHLKHYLRSGLRRRRSPSSRPPR